MTDDVSYLENTIRQIHDIWHVVTGFDTSVSGEIGLQAFKAKQLNWPFSMAAIGGACFIVLLKTPGKIEEFISEMSRGVYLARKLKPLILVDWNQLWHKPLEQVQIELRLKEKEILSREPFKSPFLDM